MSSGFDGVVRVRVDARGPGPGRVVLESRFFRVSWLSTRLTLPWRLAGVVEGFVYDGDSSGLRDAYRAYLERLGGAARGAGRRAVELYSERLREEVHAILDTAIALKYADGADNIYRAYGRFIGALGDLPEARLEPPILLWGRHGKFKRLNPRRAESIYIAPPMASSYAPVYMLDVYSCRTGGRIYCIDPDHLDGGGVRCGAYIRTMVLDPQQFGELVAGIAEAYTLGKRAANVLKELALYMGWVVATGYSDSFANQENIALAETYQKLLSQ